MAMLKLGMAGEPVKRLQQKLGVEADGQFGPATDAALKAYQKQNGLAVDGIAGPDTFSQMGLSELVLLMPGSTGETVKKLQAALGISADGQYGPATVAAVKAYQQQHGLDADGYAGPVTLATMKAFAQEMTPQVVEASKTSEQVAASSPADVIVSVGKSIWQTVKGIFK
ncbi:peptidoglycan-binding protein [Vineibacter terrae]|uniref:peptidoglycan-binding domain-containing protein n=1 Tax=Vineibacter terrae TaxID=2586908 RepID=UPI002E34E64A|nr:peptidoglycan-binding protein [Vineibacter terrae]HEX2887281.1 peptidoglycan-binding protein [Vineibacter terrae]